MSERSLEVVLFADHLGTVMTGGAERVAAELLSHWPQQDRLHVVTATSDESFGSPRHEVTRLRQRRFGRLIGAEASIAPGALRAARRAVGASTDVVIVNGLHFPGSIAGVVAARRSGTPVVLVSHLGGVDDLPRRTRLPAMAYERTVGRWMVRSADALVAVSADAAQHLVELGADAERVVTVENAVDSDHFVRGPRPTDRLEVAVIGRLAGNKRPLETASALRRVSVPMRVRFVGDGALESRLRDLVDGDPRFEVVPPMADVAPVLATSHVAVRWSTSEGRSLSVLEAMAAECAVVVSDIPANRAVVDHEVDGLVVDVDDATAVTAAVDRLAEDPSLRERLGAVARERVAGRGWADVAAQVRKVAVEAVDG